MRFLRLLRADLLKLWRPLPFAMLAAAVIVTAMVVRQHVVDMSASIGKVGRLTNFFGLPPRVAAVSLLESPVGVAKAVADEMASLLGAVVVLFVAGAHVAGEWNGRTLKVLLTQESRRGRVLASKVLSTWIAGVVVLIGMWVGLAVFTALMVRAWPLPGVPGLSVALRTAGPDLLRSLVVVGVFSVLGVCFAVLTRSTLGTVIAGVFVVGISMELGNMASVARYSPSYFVDGWMGFSPPGNALTPLAIWNTVTPPGVPAPGVAWGAVGLSLLVVALAAIAWARFRRMDIAG